uniref:F-box domain-containing protein n=1 Tax=Meloidogyne hapla TaxID=6305 RepID=A0A1I8B0F4_MELHA
MNFLPIEIKLEILQCLNYDQLFTLKKTNSHLYYLINRYERTLARMEFLKMEITASFSYPIRGVIDSEDGMDPTPYPNPGVIEFGIFDLPFANLIKKAKLPSEEIKMKHIETTTNFSNKLPCISFDNISWPHLDLKERVEIIETREYEDFSSTRYKLTNKYNPKMRVSITHEVSSGGIINIFIGKFMT